MRTPPTILHTWARTEVVSSIDAKPLIHVWPGVLFAGKLTMFVGDPGLGKSQVTLDVAARITRGSTWPCSKHQATVGEVLLMSAEDDPADTIRPRLEAAGADLEKVHILQSIATIDTNREQTEVWTELTKHLEIIREFIVSRKSAIKLLVIDPITAFLGDLESHNNSAVRGALGALSKLGAETGAAILAVSHLNKAAGAGKAMYRVSGSLAFVAASRAVYLIERDPDDEHMRLMGVVKNNLAKDRSGFRYSIGESDNGAPYVKWDDEPMTRDINDVLDEVATSPRSNAREDGDRKVEVWLRERIQGGSIEARSLWQQAEAAQHSRNRVSRVLKAMGAKCEIKGFAGNWHWSLPPHG